jgi:uncharacterized OsmC-like protein
MPDTHTHHITVRLDHGYEFVATFDDVPGTPTLRFDEPEPLGRNEAPNAAAVLGAAVGACLSASLTFCLRRARVDIQDVTANVTTHVTRNDRGRFRIGGIDVELSPTLGSGAQIDRCEDLFQDFCTVTASVKQGIPVHVSLTSEQKDAAA